MMKLLLSFHFGPKLAKVVKLQIPVMPFKNFSQSSKVEMDQNIPLDTMVSLPSNCLIIQSLSFIFCNFLHLYKLTSMNLFEAILINTYTW